jgi:hypothetical protein
MTRNSKSPSFKGTPKKVPKKNASDSPERKAIGARSTDRGEKSDIPLEEPATTVASPQPPGEEQLKEVIEPIAKHEDSSSTKNDLVFPSQDTNPSTPQAPVHRQLEEQQLKTVEVTFVEKTPAISITYSRRQRARVKSRKTAEVTLVEKAPAISITYSRRQRSHRAKCRTAEARSRDEQAVFSNLSIVDDAFSLATGNGPGYTQAERNGICEYVEEIVSAGQAARLP